MTATLRQVAKRLTLMLSIVAGAFALLTAGFWYPGVTPTQTARILIKDRKFGARALKITPLWGDRMLEPLRELSGDFNRLDNRSAPWVASALAANSSERSKALSRQLFARDSLLPSMLGAAALAAHGELPPSAFRPGGRVSSALNDASLFPDRADSARVRYDEPWLELAIKAARNARSRHSVDDLVRLLSTPQGYWTHAHVCEALGAIGDARAIEPLRSAMRDTSFHALPDAFLALVALGDSLAIPLAIARVSPDIERYNSGFIVRELENVTGQDFGYDRGAWQRWWDSRR